MFSFSLRIVLVSSYMSIFAAAWLLPIYFIYQGLLNPLDNCVDILVNQTASAMTTNLGSEFRIYSFNGFSVRNWSYRNGLPFKSNISENDFIKFSLGHFYNLPSHREPFSFRRWSDGSMNWIHVENETVVRYDFCRSPKAVYNSSFTLLTHPLEQPTDCTFALLDRNTLQPILPDSDYNWSSLVPPITGPSTYANSPGWNATFAYFYNTSSYFYNDWYYLTTSYSPVLQEKFLMNMLQASFHPPPNINIPLYLSIESIPTSNMNLVLRKFLPVGSDLARSFLLEMYLLSSAPVVADSRGPVFDEYFGINSTTQFRSDARFNKSSLCIYSAASRSVGCKRNFSTYPDYAILRQVNALHDPNRTTPPNRITFDGDGEVYFWSEAIAAYSPKVYFRLFVFIPTSFFLNPAINSMIVILGITCGLVVVGGICIYLILRPVLRVVENLIETMAKDPFDPEIVRSFSFPGLVVRSDGFSSNLSTTSTSVGSSDDDDINSAGNDEESNSDVEAVGLSVDDYWNKQNSLKNGKPADRKTSTSGSSSSATSKSKNKRKKHDPNRKSDADDETKNHNNKRNSTGDVDIAEATEFIRQHSFMHHSSTTQNHNTVSIAAENDFASSDRQHGDFASDQTPANNNKSTSSTVNFHHGESSSNSETTSESPQQQQQQQQRESRLRENETVTDIVEKNNNITKRFPVAHPVSEEEDAIKQKYTSTSSEQHNAHCTFSICGFVIKKFHFIEVLVVQDAFLQLLTMINMLRCFMPEREIDLMRRRKALRERNGTKQGNENEGDDKNEVAPGDDDDGEVQAEKIEQVMLEASLLSKNNDVNDANKASVTKGNNFDDEDEAEATRRRIQIANEKFNLNFGDNDDINNINNNNNDKHTMSDFLPMTSSAVLESSSATATAHLAHLSPPISEVLNNLHQQRQDQHQLPHAIAQTAIEEKSNEENFLVTVKSNSNNAVGLIENNSSIATATALSTSSAGHHTDTQGPTSCLKKPRLQNAILTGDSPINKDDATSKRFLVSTNNNNNNNSLNKPISAISHMQSNNDVCEDLQDPPQQQMLQSPQLVNSLNSNNNNTNNDTLPKRKSSSTALPPIVSGSHGDAKRIVRFDIGANTTIPSSMPEVQVKQQQSNDLVDATSDINSNDEVNNEGESPSQLTMNNVKPGFERHPKKLLKQQQQQNQQKKSSPSSLLPQGNTWTARMNSVRNNSRQLPQSSPATSKAASPITMSASSAAAQDESNTPARFLVAVVRVRIPAMEKFDKIYGKGTREKATSDVQSNNNNNASLTRSGMSTGMSISNNNNVSGGFFSTGTGSPVGVVVSDDNGKNNKIKKNQHVLTSIRGENFCEVGAKDDDDDDDDDEYSSSSDDSSRDDDPNDDDGSGNSSPQSTDEFEQTVEQFDSLKTNGTKKHKRRSSYCGDNRNNNNINDVDPSVIDQSKHVVSSPTTSTTTTNEKFSKQTKREKLLQKLIDETKYAVKVINRKVLLPTGSSLIEYRNDFFVIGLRLAKKNYHSRLGTRFVECLMEASEVLARHYTKKAREREKQRQQKLAKRMAKVAAKKRVDVATVVQEETVNGALNAFGNNNNNNDDNDKVEESEIMMRTPQQEENQGKRKNDENKARNMNNNNENKHCSTHADERNVLGKAAGVFLTAGIAVGFARVLTLQSAHSNDKNSSHDQAMSNTTQNNNNSNNNNNNNNSNNNNSRHTVTGGGSGGDRGVSENNNDGRSNVSGAQQSNNNNNNNNNSNQTNNALNQNKGRTLPLRPFTIVGNVVTKAVECERRMRLHVDKMNGLEKEQRLAFKKREQQQQQQPDSSSVKIRRKSCNGKDVTSFINCDVSPSSTAAFAGATATGATSSVAAEKIAGGQEIRRQDSPGIMRRKSLNNNSNSCNKSTTARRISPNSPAPSNNNNNALYFLPHAICHHADSTHQILQLKVCYLPATCKFRVTTLQPSQSSNNNNNNNNNGAFATTKAKRAGNISNYGENNAASPVSLSYPVASSQSQSESGVFLSDTNLDHTGSNNNNNNNNVGSTVGSFPQFPMVLLSPPHPSLVTANLLVKKVIEANFVRVVTTVAAIKQQTKENRDKSNKSNRDDDAEDEGADDFDSFDQFGDDILHSEIAAASVLRPTKKMKKNMKK